jgi:hypothetical protein
LGRLERAIPQWTDLGCVCSSRAVANAPAQPGWLCPAPAVREKGSGGGRRGGAARGEPAHGCLHVARPITLAHWVDTDVGRIRRVQRRAREVMCRHKLRNAHCQKACRARSARTGARLLTKLNMFGVVYFRLDTNPLLPVRFGKEHVVNNAAAGNASSCPGHWRFLGCGSALHGLASKPTTVKMNGTAVHHSILLLVACATRSSMLCCPASLLKVELYQQNLWQLSNHW